MASQQQFKGATVEAVLAEVRAALGPDAEIVEANKIRSGGIGGFFSKESYEVLAKPRSASRGRPGLPMEIDEAAFDRGAAMLSAARNGTDTSTPPPAPAEEPRVGRGLMDLVDMVSDAEQGPMPRTEAPPEPAPVASAPPSPAVPPVARPVTQTPTPVIRPSLPPFEPFATEAMPRVSTEGGAFNDVLHRIAADAGPEIAEAIDRRFGVPGEADPTRRPLTPVGPQMRLTSDLMTAAPRAAEVALTEVEDMVEATVSATIDREAAMPRVADLVEPAGALLEDRTSRLLSWLQRDNLPRTTVLTALRGLPQVPSLPDTTGVVVAVVGRRQDALKLCRRLARQHSTGADSVVLASSTYRGRSRGPDQLIVDLTDAARDRTSWRRRERPTFVAVESPSAIDGATLTWTREIVAELEAHMVIGVVDAGRKVEDVGTWAERVGGVDALALVGIDATTTPYAVLELEIPVGWLEMDLATPAAWAHVLLDGSDSR